MCKIAILNFKIFVLLVIKKINQFQLRALKRSKIRPAKANMTVFDPLREIVYIGDCGSVCTASS